MALIVETSPLRKQIAPVGTLARRPPVSGIAWPNSDTASCCLAAAGPVFGTETSTDIFTTKSAGNSSKSFTTWIASVRYVYRTLRSDSRSPCHSAPGGITVVDLRKLVAPRPSCGRSLTNRCSFMTRPLTGSWSTTHSLITPPTFENVTRTPSDSRTIDCSATGVVAGGEGADSAPSCGRPTGEPIDGCAVSPAAGFSAGGGCFGCGNSHCQPKKIAAAMTTNRRIRFPWSSITSACPAPGGRVRPGRSHHGTVGYSGGSATSP